MSETDEFFKRPKGLDWRTNIFVDQRRERSPNRSRDRTKGTSGQFHVDKETIRWCHI